MQKDKIVFRSVGKSKQITLGVGLDVRIKSQEHSQEENLGAVSMIKNANGSFKSFSSPHTKKQSSPYFNKNKNNLVQMTLSNFIVKKDLKTQLEEDDLDDNLKETTQMSPPQTPSDSDVENFTQKTKRIRAEGTNQNEIVPTTDQPSQQNSENESENEINTSKQTNQPKPPKRTTKKTSPTQKHKKTTKMKKKNDDAKGLSDEEMQEEEEILQTKRKRKNIFEEFAYQIPKKQKIGMPIPHPPQNVEKKSQNVKEDDKDIADENEDDAKAESLSAYELQRLQNIQKNRELMVCETKKKFLLEIPIFFFFF